MNYLYEEDYLDKIQIQRKRLLVTYIVLLSVIVVAVVLSIIYYSTRPYKWEYGTLFKTIVIVVAALFVVFSTIFLEIPFGRVNRYYKLIKDLFSNELLKSNVTFISFDDRKINKYGVDFYYINVLEWSDIENDYVERSIMVDKERKVKEFRKGEIFEVYTAGNILFKYSYPENNFN